MSEALNPSPSLLAKLGSLFVHAEEFIETANSGDLKAAQFDLEAMRGLLVDPDLRQWRDEMKAMCMLPEKRKA